ncbi:MAG: D-sedoheptulose 7-phosphate isomerase [Candidatus Omnitrophota bacterium]
MKKKIENILRDSINVKEKLLSDSINIIAQIASQIITSLKNGGKLIIFGNGGSAADAQHIAAELIGRFQKERRALAALALTTNTSVLTALANDYGYETVFSRQLEALADKKDVVLAISTSGNAKNVNIAVRKAKADGIKTIAFTGQRGGELAKLADIALIIPSKITARIQEVHITVGHILCELIEDELTK